MGDGEEVGHGRTVVLVHGAWHGAWCWDRVVPLLGERGVDAVALDLPGHGTDRGPFADLHGDAAHVRAELDRHDDVVLVGHSYGGAVITEAGAHPAVRHLVYLAALALAEDETCQAAATAEAEAAGISHEGRLSLGDALVMAGDGTSTLAGDDITELFYADCAASDVELALARLGAQPMANMGQSPSAVAWRTVPSTYVVCADDRAIHPGLQRLMARRCTASVEWPTSHSPFFSRPELVAELLAGLAHT